MSDLKPEKLHVTYQGKTSDKVLSLPRRYTLTHSDRTGDLYLTIGADYDLEQISGWYTRLMRDEALGEWLEEGRHLSLHIYCHVSGGFVLGGAKWRNDILHHHMRLVIEAIVHGDRSIITSQSRLAKSKVWVHFGSHKASFNRVEDWETVEAYI
ncbi:MAG: hypothetical protein JW704_12670 [Anaerolineaceae bacterium]|nr:hypothetical protein [Anaerolineaceae bacterium]